MADTPKILGQLNPSATTWTTIYTVPGATKCVISLLTVCNFGSSDGTIRLRIKKAGAGDDNKQYVYYDAPVGAKEPFEREIPITLEPTDVVAVYASDGNFAVNLFGIEIT
jgi:hypothetical protein